MRLAFSIAKRELRGGLKGFRVFLICLALGVAAIAGVGVLRGSIQGALADQGAVLLGGDAEMRFTYRAADANEMAFMEEAATHISSVIDFRSMVTIEGDSALTEVKAIDAAWPLYGEARLSPDMPLPEALAGRDGLPGVILAPILIDRLGLEIGDQVKLGTQNFVLTASLLSEPDGAASGFALGPRTLLRSEDLAQSGLLGAGAMFETRYRLALPPETDLAALETRAKEAFQDKGMRWRDSRNAAPGIERFVNNIGSFLVLVGLAGLAVGGVGISAAVRAWLQGKIATIATLKTLGASMGTIFTSYLIQIAALGVLGILAGLLLGAVIPLALAPLIEASLPFPADITLTPRALLEAAFYGAMVVLIFTLLPLARAERTRAAALYRGTGERVVLRARWIAALIGLIAALLAVVVWASGVPALALGAAGGVIAALFVLTLAALGLRRLAKRLARARLGRGRPMLRAALAAIGGPGSEAVPVVLSLGLGLSVLAAVGQIEANMRAAITRDLPSRAPAFFFVDIQPDQITPFLEMIDANPAVTKRESAPMLRGVITQINGKPARDVAGDHWVVRGDRGVSYADALPEGTRITKGAFWPEGYTGPPQISFGQTEADEIGLKLGDTITTNILGREITAEITSFREVEFSSGGMGFVMVMNAAALRGAPHSHIATVYAPPEAEAPILRETTKTWPNITAIPIRETITMVTEALEAIATATAWAAGGTLVTGFAVLIGAAAAGERARTYEAALMKVLGATRRRILASFALRAALLGAAAGAVAVFAGAIAGWAVMTFVMETPYAFEPLSALGIILGGIFATLLAGMVFASGPLRSRPAAILRAQD